MDGRLYTLGAKGWNTGLRALFCLCLLFLATAPLAEPLKTRNPNTERAADGMTAPPTPLLEPQSRFGAFGGLERRFLSALPVDNGLWVAERFYQGLPLPTFNQPDPQPLELAQTQQWRLEGG